MDLYVGNLAQEVTEDDLRKAFEGFGSVESVRVIKDKLNNLPKGFAFVQMDANAEAQAAIEALDGSELKGKSIVVNEARPRSNKGPRGRGSNGGGRSW